MNRYLDRITVVKLTEGPVHPKILCRAVEQRVWFFNEKQEGRSPDDTDCPCPFVSFIPMLTAAISLRKLGATNRFSVLEMFRALGCFELLKIWK